jgi:hypothetical protein
VGKYSRGGPYCAFYFIKKNYCAFYFIKKRMKRKRGAGKEDNLYR